MSARVAGSLELNLRIIKNLYHWLRHLSPRSWLYRETCAEIDKLELHLAPRVKRMTEMAERIGAAP